MCNEPPQDDLDCRLVVVVYCPRLLRRVRRPCGLGLKSCVNDCVYGVVWRVSVRGCGCVLLVDYSDCVVAGCQFDRQAVSADQGD